MMEVSQTVLDDLGGLGVFVAIAESGSFTRAAGKLGMSQSALSHRMRRLEEKLGVRLLTRTTRSVSLTEAGAKLFATLRPALHEIKTQVEALSEASEKPAGIIRFTSADHAAETILWPALNKLLLKYPEISVELDVDNKLVDIVEERYDAGIRLGKNVANDMIAVPIGPMERQVIVASPSYFARRLVPISPDDLSNHLCISRRLPTLGGFPSWEFAKDGNTVKVRVTGRLAFNRPELVLEAAVAGFGVAKLLESQALPYIKAGKLVSVLDDWCPPFPGYHLYYPNRRQNSATFQIVVDALRYRGEQPNIC